MDIIRLTVCLIYKAVCHNSVLGGFAKLLEVTNSLLLSVRMELGLHRMDFQEILYLGIFRITVVKIEV